MLAATFHTNKKHTRGQGPTPCDLEVRHLHRVWHLEPTLVRKSPDLLVEKSVKTVCAVGWKVGFLEKIRWVCWMFVAKTDKKPEDLEFETWCNTGKVGNKDLLKSGEKSAPVGITPATHHLQVWQELGKLYKNDISKYCPGYNITPLEHCMSKILKFWRSFTASAAPQVLKFGHSHLIWSSSALAKYSAVTPKRPEATCGVWWGLVGFCHLALESSPFYNPLHGKGATNLEHVCIYVYTYVYIYIYTVQYIFIHNQYTVYV